PPGPRVVAQPVVEAARSVLELERLGATKRGLHVEHRGRVLLAGDAGATRGIAERIAAGTLLARLELNGASRYLPGRLPAITGQWSAKTFELAELLECADKPSR